MTVVPEQQQHAPGQHHQREPEHHDRHQPQTRPEAIRSFLPEFGAEGSADLRRFDRAGHRTGAATRSRHGPPDPDRPRSWRWPVLTRRLARATAVSRPTAKRIRPRCRSSATGLSCTWSSAAAAGGADHLRACQFLGVNRCHARAPGLPEDAHATPPVPAPARWPVVSRAFGIGDNRSSDRRAASVGLGSGQFAQRLSVVR